MKKASLLKIINPVLGLLVFVQILTVLGKKFEWQFAPFDQMHEYNAYAMGVIIIIHLVLNWSWIRINYLPKKKAKS